MGFFDFIKSAFSANAGKVNDAGFDAIIDAAYKEMKAKGHRYWWSLKANEIETFCRKHDRSNPADARRLWG